MIDRAPTARKADVVIVGAGPAGLTLALTLSSYSVSTILVERRAVVGSRPRATGLSSRSMEVFRVLGCESEIRNEREDIPLSIAFAECVTSPDPVSSFAIAPAAVTKATSPSGAVFVPQDRLEEALRRCAAGTGLIEILHSTALADFRADDRKVVCEVEDLTNSVRSSVEGQILVGADGARSTVRALAEIGAQVWPGAAPEQHTYAFSAPLWPRIRPADRHSLYVVVDPARKSSVWPVGDDRWVYADQREPASAFGTQEAVRRIREATGVRELPIQLGRAGRFSMDCQVADRFTRGRVHLIGDAAHAVAPRGGTGLNSAIQDAFNLGWRIGWCVLGWASGAAVAGYEDERRPLAIRDAEVASAPVGLMRDMYEELSLEQAGRLRHLWLDDKGKVSSLDLVGPGLTLFLGPEAEGFAGRLPESVQVHRTEPLIARQLGIAAQGGLLVRPDGVPLAAWRRELPAWADRILSGGDLASI